MLKISLKNLNLKEVEQLSREQLKDVLGGGTDGTGPSETLYCPTSCANAGDSCQTTDCKTGTCIHTSEVLTCTKV